MPYEVINLDTDESHGVYETLEEARGCVRFDKLRTYSIWRGEWDRDVDPASRTRWDFCGIDRVVCCEPDEHDPENIYGLASIRQSIEEDRR